MPNVNSWEEVAGVRKRVLRRCEVCGRILPPSDLRARHLDYSESIDLKNMIILCEECNYHFYLAEDNNKTKLAELNRTYAQMVDSASDFGELSLICRDYVDKRGGIIADSIIEAVGLNSTSRRPNIDCLFSHPNFNGEDTRNDGIMWQACHKTGTWDGLAHQPIAKQKLNVLRKAEKEKRRKLKMP